MIDFQAATAVPLPAEQIQQLVDAIDKLRTLLATVLSVGSAGFLSAKAVEGIKNSRQVQFLRHDSSTRAKQIAGGTAATFASVAAAIAVTWTKTGHLVIDISVFDVAPILGHAAMTWIAQQIWYQALVKQPAHVAIVAKTDHGG